MGKGTTGAVTVGDRTLTANPAKWWPLVYGGTVQVGVWPKGAKAYPLPGADGTTYDDDSGALLYHGNLLYNHKGESPSYSDMADINDSYDSYLDAVANYKDAAAEDAAEAEAEAESSEAGGDGATTKPAATKRAPKKQTFDAKRDLSTAGRYMRETVDVGARRMRETAGRLYGGGKAVVGGVSSGMQKAASATVSKTGDVATSAASALGITSTDIAAAAVGGAGGAAVGSALPGVGTLIGALGGAASAVVGARKLL